MKIRTLARAPQQSEINLPWRQCASWSVKPVHCPKVANANNSTCSHHWRRDQGTVWSRCVELYGPRPYAPLPKVKLPYDPLVLRSQCPGESVGLSQGGPLRRFRQGNYTSSYLSIAGTHTQVWSCDIHGTC